jgi:L-lactate dehydrogenase complex protein LldG
MNARNEILQTLRANTRATTLPTPWRSDRHFDDPAGRFTEALTKVKGYVHRARTMDDALNQLAALFADLNIHSVVYNDETPINEVDWAARFPEIQFHQSPRLPKSSSTSEVSAWRALCATADVGITSADAFLAETGSLVISSGPGKSRMVSLLPPVHIAIVPMDRLTMDIFTWKEAHSRQFPANTVLVSGPSKTADIEQTMSVGVHGPKKLIVVLVG